MSLYFEGQMGSDERRPMRIWLSLGLILSALTTVVLSANNWLAPWFAPTQAAMWLSPLAILGALIILMLDKDENGKWTFIIILIVTTGLLISLTGDQSQRWIEGNNGLPLQDGAIQTTAAAKFLWQGKNPYTTDYRDTQIGQFSSAAYASRGETGNAAWDHYAYPPGLIVLSAPLVKISEAMGFDYDGRWLTVFGLLLTVWGLTWRRKWPEKSIIVLLTVGNPLISLFAVAGYNDVLMAAAVTGAGLAWLRGRPGLSGVLVAVAATIKQTAWPFLLLWLGLIIFSKFDQQQKRRVFKRAFGGAALVASLVVIPFIIWNPAAIWDDVIMYVSGNAAGVYAFSGATLLKYFRLTDLAPTPWAAFPVSFFQAIIGLPLLTWAFMKIRSQPAVAIWWLTGAVVSLGIYLCSRSFPYNYAGPIILVILAAATVGPGLANSSTSKIDSRP